MLFNSFEFLFIFLPITYIGYCLLNKFKMYKLGTVWLLIASLYFYAYYKIEYLPLILLSILFNYTIGTVLLKKDLGKFKKPFLVFGLIGNLGLLCYYKLRKICNLKQGCLYRASCDTFCGFDIGNYKSKYVYLFQILEVELFVSFLCIKKFLSCFKFIRFGFVVA